MVGAENSFPKIINRLVICIASITIRLSTRMDSLSMTFDRPISKNEGVNINTEIKNEGIFYHQNPLVNVTFWAEFY